MTGGRGRAGRRADSSLTALRVVGPIGSSPPCRSAPPAPLSSRTTSRPLSRHHHYRPRHQPPYRKRRGWRRRRRHAALLQGQRLRRCGPLCHHYPQVMPLLSETTPTTETSNKSRPTPQVRVVRSRRRRSIRTASLSRMDPSSSCKGRCSNTGNIRSRKRSWSRRVGSA